jgi:hypothetical protein
VARGYHGWYDALELKPRLLTYLLDLCRGVGLEQEKDHVVACYLDRADVCDRTSLPLQLDRALRETLRGVLHPLSIEVWPEALNHERCVRE